MIWDVTREELERLYGDGVTQEHLAARYYTHRDAVRARMRALGVPTAPHNKRRWAAVTPELLRALYWDQGYSAAEIGTRYGVTDGAVRRRLVLCGIATRPRGTKSRAERLRLAAWHALSAAELIRLHDTEGLSCAAIGRRYGVSGRSVGARLAELGVPRRAREAYRRPPAWFRQPQNAHHAGAGSPG